VSVLWLSAFGAACSSTDVVTCGEGTVLAGDMCVAANDGGFAPAGPTFGGVTAVAPVSPTALLVTWDDARSASTPPERMRYAVFVGSAGSPIDFTKPIATTDPGASFVYLKQLQAKPYDVTVRAVDEAGRTDDNVVVKSLAPSADATPPTFAGVKAAEAAAPGTLTVHWDPAQDDLTPPAAIVYYVYIASPEGTFDFSLPAVVTRPGATSATLGGLYDGQRLYRMVVRARDASENIETNMVSTGSRSGADVAPPRFGGCKTAVAETAGSAVVSWDPATDDTTPHEAISYDIYAATQEGNFDFSKPLLTTAGRLDSTVTGIASNTTWHFVCRARDFSGNRDANVIERVTKTLADSTPPTFGGLTGSDFDPVARTVRLSWAPGADDKTPADQLVYDVYEGTAPGAEVFTAPRASSTPGALSVLVTDLEPDATLYWVVRARDQGGSHDANSIESTGKTHVSFSRQVQSILTHDCAVSGCHVPGSPAAGLILAQGFAFESLVNVRSSEKPLTPRVTPGDPTTSYLWQKMSMNPPPAGWQMPAPATGSVVPANELDLVRRWILQGAAKN
jgi:hypothetical protein